MNREASWGAVGANYEPPAEDVVVCGKVAVLGHSQVRDLALPAYVLNGDKHVVFRKYSVPGATVASLKTSEAWARFRQYKPDLTFLVIGGNDITAQCSAPHVAREIIDLAKEVKTLTSGEVRIFTIERRPGPRGMGHVKYNRIRNSVNRYLKHRDPFTKERLLFSEARDSDSQDGVHLRLGAADHLVWRIVDHSEVYAGRNW